MISSACRDHNPLTPPDDTWMPLQEGCHAGEILPATDHPQARCRAWWRQHRAIRLDPQPAAGRHDPVRRRAYPDRTTMAPTRPRRRSFAARSFFNNSGMRYGTIMSTFRKDSTQVHEALNSTGHLRRGRTFAGGFADSRALLCSPVVTNLLTRRLRKCRVDFLASK